MCNCITTVQVLDNINAIRQKKGLTDIPYQNFMLKWKSVRKFIPANGKIGNSYVFSEKTAKLLTTILWDMDYNPHITTRIAIWKNQMAG